MGRISKPMAYRQAVLPEARREGKATQDRLRPLASTLWHIGRAYADRKAA